MHYRLRPPITGAQRKKIRELRKQGLTYKAISEQLGLTYWTTWRYASDQNEQTQRRREIAKHEAIMKNPEALARKHAGQKRYRDWQKMEAKRAKENCDNA